ncbi:MAG: cytochrome c biogenesis protein CcdA [Mariprofundales bacterium]
MIEVTFLGALLAGLLSFLSPCVLPLVPAYLSYISGVSIDALQHGEARKRAMLQSLWFISGFSLVFILLGASATLAGQWMLSHLNILGKLAGVIIFIFGLHYTKIIQIPWLLMDAHVDTSKLRTSNAIGAITLGAAFAFGWTPCVGPILGAILSLAGAQANILHGMLLLATYSMGLGIPFLFAAWATNGFMRWMRDFRHYFNAIEIFSGILLMIVGILFFLGSFSTLSGWLLQYAPFLSEIEGTLLP